jgi:SHS2 domain-containing protein
MYKILPHTADIKFQIRGQNLEGIFKNSLTAINKYLQPSLVKNKNKKYKKELIIKLSLKGENFNILIIDFLNEVLSLIYIKKMIFRLKKLKIINNCQYQFILEGYPYLNLKKEIKAITYHQAELIKKNRELVFNFIVDV